VNLNLERLLAQNGVTFSRLPKSEKVKTLTWWARILPRGLFDRLVKKILRRGPPRA